MKKNSFLVFRINTYTNFTNFLYTIFIPKHNTSNINELTSKLSLTYLTYTRYKALMMKNLTIQIHFGIKKRWTIKFFRCRNSEDGIYFSIYSDNNKQTSKF